MAIKPWGPGYSTGAVNGNEQKDNTYLTQPQAQALGDAVSKAPKTGSGSGGDFKGALREAGAYNEAGTNPTGSPLGESPDNDDVDGADYPGQVTPKA